MCEEKPVCHEFYCIACDMPSEEHREGSCRCCGSPLTMLAKKKEPGSPACVTGLQQRKAVPACETLQA